MENQYVRPVTGYPASAYPNSTTTTGSAYPYAAPPPQSAYYYNNNNPYYAQPYPDPRAAFLRRLVVIIAASFIIAGTIVFIVWLVLRPRVPEFRVDSVSLSNFNLSSTSSLLTGNWDVKFAVSNPNHKISLYYDHIAASVFYKDESLSETTVAPFDQGTRNQTTVTATFATAARYVDKKAADSILSDRTSRGIVDFNVRMVARVRLKAGSWQERRRFMRVYCGNLAVGLSSQRRRYHGWRSKGVQGRPVSGFSCRSISLPHDKHKDSWELT
ncbi:NDR1/HIN1-like protein 10 isoform X2 [Actinidia eriantha]|uniref:NDR1/HIN1-like protein 10 isoform X2 n=1 Tax=Actinidia eriantha TaxID=165200 RepID=UPI0025880827|nr:NDR1/HIN1-like protein 10 isoform X2 [Actinidia eriantha]